MRSILYGIGAVIGFCALVAALMGIIVGWFNLCDKLWDSGHPTLAGLLTPMAFIGYIIVAAVFLVGYGATKKGAMK